MANVEGSSLGMVSRFSPGFRAAVQTLLGLWFFVNVGFNSSGENHEFDGSKQKFNSSGKNHEFDGNYYNSYGRRGFDSLKFPLCLGFRGKGKY